MLKIRVPATSANMGPGFDSFGVALALYNYVELEESDNIIIKSLDGSFVPVDDKNLVLKAIKRLYADCGKSFYGITLLQENNIPMTRGLGSSSACIVAGLLGANKLLNEPLNRDELLNLAAQLEGHPDNVTPAFTGGFAVSVMDNLKVHYINLPVPDKMGFTAFIPEFKFKTRFARKVLPDKALYKDVVYNISRAGLLAAAIATGRLEHLSVAISDKLHEPYRIAKIPGGESIFKLAKQMGAYACYISGSGPTIIAITDSNNETFIEMCKTELAKRSITKWDVIPVLWDKDGVKFL
jgi:homoserine kinase